MTNEFWSAIVLVVATAAATGGVSLLATWQQNRFAERKRQAERNEALTDRNVANSRSHALEMHTALQNLLELGSDAIRESGGLPDKSAAQPMLAAARSNYLLIEDDPLRTVVADGLTLVQGAWVRNIPADEWRRATADTAFVLAAYLRGATPPKKYVDELRELRAQYPAPGSSPVADIISEVRESG